ncbi:MAG: hypothetical protein JNK24_02625 [Alphaproteobacteria bacterium]|nr:hypothetical protein [Alphaproteobacteria bacterium]
MSDNKVQVVDATQGGVATARSDCNVIVNLPEEDRILATSIADRNLARALDTGESTVAELVALNHGLYNPADVNCIVGKMKNNGAEMTASAPPPVEGRHPVYDRDAYLRSTPGL